MPAGRILVVDDDRMVRDTVGRVLEDEGYAVDYAQDGREALECIRAHPPDAILLDIMMPGMNGRQFLAALREQLGIEDIPIVVMTAVHGINLHQAYALGASDVIEKPFDIDVMLNKIALAVFRSRDRIRAGETTDSGIHSIPDDDADGANAAGVVIIVDNDRATSRQLDEALRERGYTVVSMARVTDELCRLARVLEPRAILLAMRPPAVDGLAALRQLREDEALNGVAVLLVAESPSALADARDEIDELAAAAAVKPIDANAILAFVGRPPTSATRR